MTKPVTLISGLEIPFGAFRLEIARHRLWRGADEVPLRPKSWDALCYLLARPGLLVAEETAPPRRMHEDARRLRSLYGSFTEGFDTRDLRDAAALLKDLET